MEVVSKHAPGPQYSDSLEYLPVPLVGTRPSPPTESTPMLFQDTLEVQVFSVGSEGTSTLSSKGVVDSGPSSPKDTKMKETSRDLDTVRRDLSCANQN